MIACEDSYWDILMSSNTSNSFCKDCFEKHADAAASGTFGNQKALPKDKFCFLLGKYHDEGFAELVLAYGIHIGAMREEEQRGEAHIFRLRNLVRMIHTSILRLSCTYLYILTNHL